MPISFDELTKFLKPYPTMTAGFGACVYDVRVLTLDEALASLTCWDGISSVAAYAPQKAADPKVAAFVENFPLGPVIAIAFELDTLARIWSEKYGGRAGRELVIWDGNHRLAALALRRARGVLDDVHVGVFVGV
jgi:hypothetical protein